MFFGIKIPPFIRLFCLTKGGHFKTLSILSFVDNYGGDEGDWTLDPQIANLVLSHLSYVPMQYIYYTVIFKMCKLF